MDYIQGLAAQTEIFFLALGFGFLLGIMYDVFRILRLIISRSAVFTVFMDILYFLLCAFLVFCFDLAVDSGKIRLYVLLGDLLGWLVYYFSLGEVSIRVGNRIILSVKKFFSMFFKPFSRFGRFIKRKFGKIIIFYKKITRKFNKKSKYILQKHAGMVYNLIGYIENNTFKDK